MIIGERLRTLREQKGLSQGDVEKATGLLRCYISRVEHGHTIPSLETLERFSEALNVPLYQLFCVDGGAPPKPRLTPRPSLEELAMETGASGTDARYLLQLRDLIAHMIDSDRAFLLDFARNLVSRRSKLSPRQSRGL